MLGIKTPHFKLVLRPEFLSAGNTVFLVGRRRISDPMDQAQDVLFDPGSQVNVSMTQSAAKCKNVQYPKRGIFLRHRVDPHGTKIRCCNV
jgi:hypothetical protein